jgi:TetR/AcrR family transcriptional repressor of nem operon
MKVSKDKAAQNRERILIEAARLFRECGGSGMGIDALAEAAGMTHGSVYSQFGSKDKVMAEAIKHGHAKSSESSQAVKSLTEAIAGYLSAGHRDHRGHGCFMAALAGDTRIIKASGKPSLLCPQLGENESNERYAWAPSERYATPTNRIR